MDFIMSLLLKKEKIFLFDWFDKSLLNIIEKIVPNVKKWAMVATLIIAATTNPSSIVQPIAFEEKDITTSLIPRLDGVMDTSSAVEVSMVIKAILNIVEDLPIAI